MRKNQNTLTADEKKRFVDAVIRLKKLGRYDNYVSVHNDFIRSDTDNGRRVGHHAPSFLPWHRKFLLDFENDLKSIDSTVELPYWDWTVNNTPSGSPWTRDRKSVV